MIQIPARPLPSRILTCSLAPNGCEKLASISRTLEFEPGHLIFRRNEQPAAMWMVTNGTVRVSLPEIDPEGDLPCGRGIYGLTETIAGIPYQASLMSVTHCTCMHVERDPLLDLLGGEHDACTAIIRMLSRNYIRGVRKLAS